MKVLHFNPEGISRLGDGFEFVRPFFDLEQPIHAYAILRDNEGLPASYLCRRHFPDESYSPNSEWLHRMVYESGFTLEEIDDRMTFIRDVEGGYIDLNPQPGNLEPFHFRWIDSDFVYGVERNSESASHVLDRVDRL